MSGDSKRTINVRKTIQKAIASMAPPTPMTVPFALRHAWRVLCAIERRTRLLDDRISETDATLNASVLAMSSEHDVFADYVRKRLDALENAATQSAAPPPSTPPATGEKSLFDIAWDAFDVERPEKTEDAITRVVNAVVDAYRERTRTKDGKTPGQRAYEDFWGHHAKWHIEDPRIHKTWEAVAAAARGEE